MCIYEEILDCFSFIDFKCTSLKDMCIFVKISENVTEILGQTIRVIQTQRHLYSMISVYNDNENMSRCEMV